MVTPAMRVPAYVTREKHVVGMGLAVLCGAFAGILIGMALGVMLAVSNTPELPTIWRPLEFVPAPKPPVVPNRRYA